MNKFNLLVVLKAVFIPIALFVFASCGDGDEGIHSNTIVGKWHIATTPDKLIFNPDNTGLWIQGSEKKEFTWRAAEFSNAISVWQKFPGNGESEWILEFFKEECSENVLNGSYETYTYNVGYIDNMANSIIKLYRHNNDCRHLDYNGPSDWDNYNDNNANGENEGNGNSGSNNGNSGNEGGGNNGGGSSNHHYPCKSCDESGKCWNCFGSGKDPITNKKCNTCHGTGKCQTCNGKGYIIV